MIKLIRLELRKILTYKIFWVILGLYFLFLGSGIVLAELIINSWVNNFNKQIPIPLPHVNIYFFPDIWQNLTFFASIRYVLIFPAILIIILITNEFTNKTIRQNIVTGLSRAEFLLSKLLFILILSFCITFILATVMLILGISHSEVTGLAMVFKGSSYIFGFFTALLSFLLFSFFFGFIFRNTGLAIALFMLYVIIVEPVISSVSRIPKLHIHGISSYLPANSALDIIQYPHIPFLKNIMGLNITNGISFGACSIPLLYSAILIGIVFLITRRKAL